jgi:DtxR family Mn-dependent transcriptional regulator
VTSKESGRLVDMKTGDKLVVIEVDDKDPELLRYLGEMGIYPGTELHLVDYAPFNGPLTLALDHGQHSLGYQAAKASLVAMKE